MSSDASRTASGLSVVTSILSPAAGPPWLTIRTLRSSHDRYPVELTTPDGRSVCAVSDTSAGGSPAAGGAGGGAAQASASAAAANSVNLMEPPDEGERRPRRRPRRDPPRSGKKTTPLARGQGR